MTALATENFNRADSTGLSSGNWTTANSCTSFNIASNTGAVLFNTFGGNYYNAVVWPNVQYGQVVLASPLATATDEGVGPVVRLASGAFTGYWVQAGAGDTRLYKIVGGTFTQLGSTDTASSIGDVIKLVANGTSITATRNGAAICGTPVTDASISSGNVGIFGSSSGPNAALDSFEGGDLNVAITSQSLEQPNRPRPGRGPFSKGRFYVSDTTAYTTAVNSALSGTSALTFAQTGVLKGTGALVGASALTFAQTGALTGAGALAGTSALVFGQTGTLTQPGLAGSAALTFGQTGTLSATGILAGTSALQFGQTAALAGAGVLAGTSALSFAQTGTLTAVGILAGASALTFAQTATLAATGALAGTAALTFGASATADAPAGALSGTAALSFGATGTLSGFGALIGTCQIVFSASGFVPNTNVQPGPVDSTRSAEGFYRRKKKRRQIERPAQPVVIAPASFEHEIPTAVIARATSFQSLAQIAGKSLPVLRAQVDQEIESLLRAEAERDDQEALQWILNALD